jgi:hypothetical protein
VPPSLFDRTFTTKPYAGARPNARAQALGVRALYLLTEGAALATLGTYPAVPGAPALTPSNNSGGLSGAFTPDGPCGKIVDGTNDRWETQQAHWAYQLPSTFTIMWKGTASATTIFFGKMVSSGNDQAYTLSSSYNSNGFVAIRTWNSGSSEFSAQSSVDIKNRRCTVHATLDGQTLRLYVDGEQVASTAFSGTLGTASTLGIGDHAGGGNGTGGLYELVCLADRCWGPGEIAESVLNPWDLLFGDRRTLASVASPPDQVLVPDGDASAGTWTTDTGATTNLYQAIDEQPTASDTDYIQSVAGPNGAAAEVTLSDGGDPLVSTGHVVSVRALIDTAAGGAMTLRTELLQSGASLSTPAFWDDALTTTAQTFAHTLSTAQTDAVTAYPALSYRFTATQATGATPTFTGAGTAQFIATNAQAIPTMSPPNGNVGDLLLLFLLRNDGTAAPSAPTGWTALASLTGVNSTLASVGTYYKYATSATGTADATGTVTFGSSTIVRGGVVLRIAGSVGSGDPTDARSLLNVASTATTMSTTNITSTSANTLGLFLPLAIGVRGTNNSTAITNWSGNTIGLQTTPLGNDLTLAYSARAFATAGSYLTPGITWGVNTTTGAGISLLLAIKPVAAGSRARVTWAQLRLPAGGDDYPAYRPWLFRARLRELLAR